MVSENFADTAIDVLMNHRIPLTRAAADAKNTLTDGNPASSSFV